MFRVYTCPRCGYTGYVRVTDRDEVTSCSMCAAPVVHTPQSVYAATREEAQELVVGLVEEARMGSARQRGRARGRGVKRRVLDIIRSLAALARSHVVTLDMVLVECAEAGINPERAMHFIDLLVSEGLLQQDADTLAPAASEEVV